MLKMLQEAKSVNLLAKKSGWQTAGRPISSPNSVSADSALREQLHQEIENKSKSCSNPTYHCGIPRVDGFEYCIRHILRDPRGQYRQCTYVYGNGRKCQHAVLKHDNAKDQALTTFCFEHSRQAQLKKTRATIGKLRDIETNEVLLNNLAHHIHLDEPIKELTKSPGDELIDVVSPQISSFVNYKNVNGMQNVLRTVRKRPRILDFASDSSDDDVSSMKITKLRKDFDESDDESMGSDDDDTLRRASIYTIQESLKLSIGKLDKVRTLYEMQAQHLNHFLKERRRKYLVDLRKEREVHCSIHDQARNTAKERLLYSKLKLLTRYHRRHGHEAVLYRKYKEKRTKSYDLQKAPSHPKCVFTEGGVKCGDRTIPCSKFCRKHILEDKKQTLFRACRVEKSNVICHEPTICIGEDTNCMLHLFIPPKQQYTQKKNDSETEDEDSTLKPITTTTTTTTETTSVSTTTVAAAAEKILKNVDVNESLQKSKSTTANVEVVPIDGNASVTPQPLKTESMKTKLQQQEEMIKKVLQNSPKSLARRQQKRHNNRRKPWTSRPKKRMQQEMGQQEKGDKVKEENQEEEEEDDEEEGETLVDTDDNNKMVDVMATTTQTTPTTTTKLLTITTTPTTTTSTTTIISITDKQQQQQQRSGGGGGGAIVVRKKPLELLKHQHHQSPALLQQQQQIEKQLQKQQVQQSPPQIFQIQNQQQQQQQQQQLLPFKRIIPQLQQQAQQKTLSLANVKQIINLHQLQQQQQQQQQQTKLPTTTTTTTTTIATGTTTTTAAVGATNIKQFINLPTQQQKHATSILMRLPTTTTTTTTTVSSIPSQISTSTTITTTIKTNILPSQQQQQQQQQQQKQVIQLPVQRTTRFQFQQNAIAAAAAAAAAAATTPAAATKTNTSVATVSNVGGSGNITYHTIPGLPKSTSVIINKQFLPKNTIVGVQQQQQQEQASSQHESAK